MKLDEYLKVIKSCPDNELANEFEIYDNFRILLKADFGRIIYDLKNSGKYSLKDWYRDTSGNEKVYLNYVLGALNIQVLNSVHPVMGEGFFSRIHWEDYETTAVIHSDMKEKIKGLTPRKAIVSAVTDLSGYIQKEKIPACFPDSKGWKHLKDDSRIVYFKP